MIERLPRAFICAHPVRHSRSPLIHRYWLRRYAIDGAYCPLDITPSELHSFLRTLHTSQWIGGNVTIPHKEAAYASVDEHDEAAQAIGAVNTIWLHEDRIVGGNTDAFGFMANLDQNAPGWHQTSVAVVLGAGGAARAVIHALGSRGVADIRIANRTAARARQLALGFGSSVSGHGWDALPELFEDAGLVVNTTPIGMEGTQGRAPDLARLPDRAIVSDIVYVPLETPLLKAARARGLATVDGLGMLLHQAVPGFARWFGRTPEVTDELRLMVIADMEKDQ